MATTTFDLGDNHDPALPVVRVRLDGSIGAPLVVVPAAVLTPDQAITYAQAIFGAAATACAQARLEVAGHA